MSTHHIPLSAFAWLGAAFAIGLAAGALAVWIILS